MKCDKCGACCKGNYGVYIFPRDVLPICEYLKIDAMSFLKDACKLEYLHTLNGDIKIYALNHQNQCQFLTSDNLCEIYERRPSQCRYAPYSFLYNLKLWRHMTCLQPQRLEETITPIERELLLELIQIGYTKFEKEV